MGHSFYLLLGLLFCFVELRIEKKMNLLVLLVLVDLKINPAFKKFMD